MPRLPMLTRTGMSDEFNVGKLNTRVVRHDHRECTQFRHPLVLRRECWQHPYFVVVGVEWNDVRHGKGAMERAR